MQNMGFAFKQKIKYNIIERGAKWKNIKLEVYLQE